MGHSGDGVGSASGRAMDEQDALAEARRRWGERAPGVAEPEWLGIGRSWELAFAEADLRASRR